ncbi:MAG: PKD domain-containing protein, partial [Clostridiaceae bacterium]|nr:PKD domain-containing protein [Clostridiaceae bacterium]
GMPDGPIYVKAYAKDTSGNVSDSSLTAPYVQYIIDQTAPAKPAGLRAEPSSGYITLYWEKGQENDLASYRLFKSQSLYGQYSLLYDKLTSLGYRDRAVEKGVTYYYKISAVDVTGNESELSEAVSSEITADTEAPEILSVYPANASTIPANPTVSVLASDNYKLDSIKMEFRKNTSDEWNEIDVKKLKEYSEVAVFNWNTNGLSEGEYQVRFIARDLDGNESVPRIVTYLLNIEPPAKPVLSVIPGGFKAELTWTSGNETDLAGFRVYRSTVSGTGYRMIKETTGTEYTDENLIPGQVYYYKVQALDIYRNESWSDEEFVEPTAEDLEKPVAVAGSDCTAVVGNEIMFDGTSSSDNDRIESYLWNFGDGSAHAVTAQPRHTYMAVGTYTVTMAVYDPSGNSAQDSLTVTVRDPQQVGTLEIRVLDDSSGAPVSNASIYVLMPDNTPYRAVTDNQGITKIIGGMGEYKVAAYKDDYKPAAATASIIPGQTALATLRLVRGPVIVGNLTVQRMTLDQIKAAGIDPADPANQSVYKYEISMAFSEEPVDFLVNGRGEFITWSPLIIRDEKRQVTHVAYPGAIAYPDYPQVKPTLAYMVVPVQASWLKEFFEVSLVLENTADAQFVVEDSTAELKLPSGLSLAKNQNYMKKIGSIEGGQKTEVKWIISSDKKGLYNLEAEFNGILKPFDAPIKAIFRTAQPFKVWGEDAVTMHIEADDWAYANEEYLFRIGMENVSDAPLYNMNFTVNEGQNYTFAKGQQLTNSVNELKQGDTVWYDYYLIPEVDGQLDLSKTVSINSATGELNANTTFKALPAPLSVSTEIQNIVIDSEGTYTFEICANIFNKKSYIVNNVKAELAWDSSCDMQLIDGTTIIDAGNIIQHDIFNTYPKEVVWKVRYTPSEDNLFPGYTIKVWGDNARLKTISESLPSFINFTVSMPEIVKATEEGYEPEEILVTATVFNTTESTKKF